MRLTVISGPALTTGAWLPGNTVTTSTSLPVCTESLAVNLSEYVPVALNVTVVSGEFGFANVTVPGPLTFDHVIESRWLLGSASSQTEASSVA